MDVSGGDLPKGFKVTIPVEMDFSGATEAQKILCCASGQSARVQLQGQKRKEKPEALSMQAMEGLKIKFTDVLTGPPPKTARDLLLEMSREDFVEMMTEDYDLSVERANEIYNVKHGLDKDSME